MDRIDFTLNGSPLTCAASGSLLDALRDHAGLTSVKDGCAPQGQCGCCTVLIDGQARVACVTPVSRVTGRSVVTLEALAEAPTWIERLTAAGASQCGFCTPGIILRLAAIPVEQRTEPKVRQALLAHLCRCTGWQTIIEAALADDDAPLPRRRDWSAAGQRATIEGRYPQRVGIDVTTGQAGFAADTAPPGAAALFGGQQAATNEPAERRPTTGDWVVAPTTGDARVALRCPPGRRSTSPVTWPVALPDGDWVATLQTTWVEPAAVELPAAWCDPSSGAGVGALANGGAFGAKSDGWIEAQAAALAEQHHRPVLASLSREDAARRGPKRPPMAIAQRSDGSGVIHVARTPGIVAAIGTIAPGWEVVEVDTIGPPTSASLRGAGWAEVAAFHAARAAQREGDADEPWCVVRRPDGAEARARLVTRSTAGATPHERLEVELSCGDVLDAIVLRSYAIGAAHMALGMVRSEAIAVDEHGAPIDVTIRSYGILRATETPPIDVTIVAQPALPAVNGSDAVFAAVLGAAWLTAGCPPRWPTMRG